MIEHARSALPVSTFPVKVSEGVIRLLNEHTSRTVLPESFSILGGGCINHAGVFKTSAGEFFIKWNDSGHLPDLFVTERRGIERLAETRTVSTPVVIATGENEGYQFIILEFLKSGDQSKIFWAQLGRDVGALHQCKATQFGLDHCNYIGSLRQSNTWCTSWREFFLRERIEPQLMMAETAGITDYTLRKKFEHLLTKLDSLLPEGTPVLLHGDLWRGNVIVGENGHPCLIDPAVYFGNAEMEIAYTKLFGTFEPEFYAAYHEVIHEEAGFAEREDIYNLYPLLVHLNLFGEAYRAPIEKILGRFQ